MEDYFNEGLAGFASALASSAPAPGGGGASALAGALAAALAEMVANLTAGKKKYAAVDGEMREIAARMSAARAELLSLIAADARAFEPLAGAFRMASGGEEERKEREEAVQAALEGACGPPLEIMRACSKVCSALEALERDGSRLALSDAGAAAALALGAARAASLNVYINCGMMADGALARSLAAEADALRLSAQTQCENVYDKVLDALRPAAGEA